METCLEAIGIETGIKWTHLNLDLRKLKVFNLINIIYRLIFKKFKLLFSVGLTLPWLELFLSQSFSLKFHDCDLAKIKWKI